MTLVMVESSAEFSPCRRYRYALRRAFADGPTVMFVGLNPSTADESRDDPTIRRCLGFARTWGYGTLIMANAYAFRATDPRDLHVADGPVGEPGEWADLWLYSLALESDLVVAAWGADPGPDPTRPEHVLHTVCSALRVRAAIGLRHGLFALGLTQNGSPRHPLYVRADVIPVSYPLEAVA